MHTAECYLLILSLANPAGLLTIVLALVLLYLGFPLGLSICHLFFVLSLTAWIDYRWFRVSIRSSNSRRLAYACLALGAAVLYVNLSIAKNILIAIAALALGTLFILGIRRLKLWPKPEVLRPTWG